MVITANWNPGIGSGNLREQIGASGFPKDVQAQLKETASDRMGDRDGQIVSAVTDAASSTVTTAQNAVDQLAGAVQVRNAAMARSQQTAQQQATSTNTQAKAASQAAEVKNEPVDIIFIELRAPREMIVGKNGDIEAIIKNDSAADIREVAVNFESEDGFKEHKVIPLRPHAQERIKFSWTPRKEGRQRLAGTLECPIDENSRNNSAWIKVEVSPVVNAAVNQPEQLKNKKFEVGRRTVIAEPEEQR